MATFKCAQCGKETVFQANMVTCPNCQAAISDDQLITLTESADIAATIETAVPAATMDAPIRLEPEENEQLLGGSSKTALAADLGYSDTPSHMETLDRTATEYASAGRGSASAIPPRTIAEADSDTDSIAEMRDYKIQTELGQGSFGIVFRATQVPLDRSVAIKLLKPLPLPPSTEGEQSKQARNQAETKIRDEFLREAQFTGKLEHPNIVPIHDIGIASGGKRADRPFYVMKEIKGISWQDVLSEKTRDENVDIFHRVVDAMGFSHSRNILHCDLKPENVMLGEFGEVLVVDWGQAVDMTRPETIRPGGTPAYCSPEMAQYWCDFGSDAKRAEESKLLIGPRSDVYLLGAILFQIVTGRAPHFGLKGETPVDVMRRASRNEIRRYDDFAKDELLQIALRALRKSPDGEISTVAQLQTELKSYEERRQSIDIRDRAFELLEEARISNNYDTYQKAKFGFEESLELWHENPTAREGLQQTRLNCAQLALKDQNFDLGLGMLTEVDTKDEIQVKDKLLLGKRKRDRRKRLVYLLSAAFAIAVVAGLAVNAVAIRVARDEQKKAAEATQIAIEKTDEAEAAETRAATAIATAAEKTKLAETAEADATLAKAEAASAKAQAAIDKAAAQTAKNEAQVANEAALMAKSKADQYQSQIDNLEPQIAQLNQDKANAIQQKDQALMDVKAAQEASQLLRYKTRITSIEQKVNLGDFKAAGDLLQFEEDKSSFEWGRLDLLSHPEVTGKSLFPLETLRGARLSGDRKTLALCFEDRIEIRDAVDLNKLIANFKDREVESMTLSHDGSQLAIGKKGQIQIVDVSTLKSMGEPISAQSILITDLNFSQAGDRLLSVGVPNKISRSVATEHELMIFELTGSEWSKMTNPKFHGDPAIPSRASFSADGNRIVTSSPDADRGDRVAYVLELKSTSKDKYYQWLNRFDEQSPRRNLKSGFVTSIFGDESGRTVISSFVSDAQSGSANQIVIWDVDQADETVAISTGTNLDTGRSQEEISYPRFNPSQTASVDAEVNSLDFNGQILLAAAGKKMIYWELPDDLTGLQLASSKVYRGHGRLITFSGILNAGSKFLTIAQGSEPEILLTDTSTYRDEIQSIEMAAGLTDGSSPSSIARSTDSRRIIIGNDHGLISINEPGSLQKPVLKWEISAWDDHILTRDHLFAVSRRDDLYRYDLVSGELEEILTGLSEIAAGQKIDSDLSNKISSIEISSDSRFAVVQRKNGRREFEIWNLADQSRRIVNYETLPGLKDVEKLPLLTISPDGQWIAGGRIRFYVWRNDGTVLGNAGVENNITNPLSSLRFIAGTKRIAVGGKGRLRVYNIEDGLNFQSYSISGFPDFLGKPNVVDARDYDGKTYLVIRKVFESSGESGLDLIRWDAENGVEVVASFPGIQQASLTSKGELLVVSLIDRAVVRLDLKTQQSRQQKIVIPARNVAGKLTDPRDIFSGVFETNTDDLVLQWTSANRKNTVSVTDKGELSNLSVIATPTLGAVGLTDKHALSFSNGKIRKWNVNLEGQPSVRPAGSIPGNFEIFQLAPDGSKALVVAVGSSKMGIIDINLGEFTAEVVGVGTGSVSSVGWSQDGNQLAIGFTDGKLAIWHEGKTELIDVRLAATPIEQLHFAGDGNSIVAIQDSSSEETGVAYVLRKSPVLDGSWLSVRLLHADRDPIRSADISADGTRVVTGSKRGRVTLWNTQTSVGTADDKDSSERELLNMHRFLSTVRFVQFGQNESSVISFETESPDNGALIFPAK